MAKEKAQIIYRKNNNLSMILMNIITKDSCKN